MHLQHGPGYLYYLYYQCLDLFFIYFSVELFQKEKWKNNGKELDVYKDLIDEQAHKIDHYNYHTENKQLQNHQDMARMLLKKQDAFITEDNKIDLFIDGHDYMTKYSKIFIMRKITYI